MTVMFLNEKRNSLDIIFYFNDGGINLLGRTINSHFNKSLHIIKIDCRTIFLISWYPTSAY